MPSEAERVHRRLEPFVADALARRPDGAELAALRAREGATLELVEHLDRWGIAVSIGGRPVCAVDIGNVGLRLLDDDPERSVYVPDPIYDDDIAGWW